MPFVKVSCKTVFYALFAVIFLGSLFSACTRLPAPSTPTTSPPGGQTKIKPYKVMGEWYHPISDASSFSQKGLASWYGKKFHGRKTANGETYDMYAMTAAHKTLPLGTFVSVENLKNGKKITVRINDRGPFVRGRIIDLSYTGAKKLDIVGPGTAPVEVIALRAPETAVTAAKSSSTQINIFETGQFTIQVGSFSTLQNAQALKIRMDETYRNVHIVEYDSGDRTYYRVRAGLCQTLDKAKEYEAALIQKGFTDAFVIAE